jgi:hypothetical protein
MRGGPIDVTPFGFLLAGIGWLYWLLAAAGLWLALRGRRPWKIKLLRSLPVILLFGIGPGWSAWQSLRWKLNLDASMALFQERCHKAGVKITRTVENVDGVVWMKWREKTSNADNFADQWKLNDPYGQDCGWEGCILKLLRPTRKTDQQPISSNRPATGYMFVETIDPRDGGRYRYTAMLKSVAESPREEFVRHVENTGYGADGSGNYLALERVPIRQFSTPYGILWADISTREDREHWIAGGSLKVIDLKTNEVIAERVGYMIDRGQGSQAGDRSPWAFAVQNACPEFPHEPTDTRRGRTLNETLGFAVQVLHPAKGDDHAR